MSFIKRKHIKILSILILLPLLNNCQLKKPNKTHGINFLENREKILIVNKTNKNDIMNTIGKPHTTSINKESDRWFYFERKITRGSLHKMGRNVLEENNILELTFDKYGILKNKKIYNKEDMKKVVYSDKETVHSMSQESLVTKFLQSVKQKMYNRK
jgi:outer membrane protein assembly factor BamE (lipoprotein component of BamABCDE complex)|tara:strand:- start:492 stop:962 length:471 start_codon:yes stop_codon:yes gene_type:complete